MTHPEPSGDPPARLILLVGTMNDAERLLDKLSSGETWTPELHELQERVSYADLTFCAFRPYINIFDPGGPLKTHTITKEARHLNTLYWEIKRQGKKPTLRLKDGTAFHPWKHYKRHVYGPEHVEKHIFENQVSYYTSGTRGLGMIYMDVDAHKSYQTDEYDGLGILRELFPAAYYRASRRGQNQYLKVRYSSPEQFNALCDKVQAKLRLLFLSRGVMCDFETKGKITTDKSGSLAKLPFTSNFHCNMRDETDDWNLASLIRFHTSPVYTVEEIESVLDSIVVDGEAVMATMEKKRIEGTTATPKEPTFEKSTAGTVEPEVSIQARTVPSKDLASTGPSPGIVEYRDHGSADGDAFARNWQVLPGFVRGFYREHRRLPSTDDALAYLHDNGLFSGEWADGAAGRRNRVASILEKIEEGFDEAKLGTGHHGELNPQKFAWWVRNHFGPHMRAIVEKRSCFDAETMTYPRKVVDVPLRFVCGFLAAAEVGIAKTVNGRVSTNWFKEMFKQMGISWNQDYYMATRDKLHSMGVIQITSRHHKTNVAWTWAKVFNIPASWKAEQRAIKARIVVVGEEEELPLSSPYITVYTKGDEEVATEVVVMPPRPPPDDDGDGEIWFDETFFETINGDGLYRRGQCA
jgi:hypothetical protein